MIIPVVSTGPTRPQQMLDLFKVVRGILLLLPTSTKPDPVRTAAILNHTLPGAVHEGAIPAPINQAKALEAVVQVPTVLVAVHAAVVQVLQLVDLPVEAVLPVQDPEAVAAVQAEAVPDHRAVNEFDWVYQFFLIRLYPSIVFRRLPCFIKKSTGRYS
jgi:hypothetical protein